MNWNELFTYSDDGHLTWKVRPLLHFQNARACGRWNAMFAGKRAGTKLRYVMIKVGNKAVQAHCIIWEMHYGPLPHGYEIDHINRDKLDNRIENLRAATRSQNCVNVLDRGASNKTGYAGVFAKRDKWQASISIDGNTKHLGTFKTPKEAHEAYRKAREQHHGDFCPMPNV